jgi:hypothetical protein
VCGNLVEIQMSYELIAFLAYMFFLFGLMLAMNNLQRYTLQPTTEEVIQEVLYNLRNLPRVNYKEEESSDDEEKEEGELSEGEAEVVQTLGESDSEREEGELSDADDEDEIQTPVRRTGLVKRRRELNPVGRILDCVD